MACPSLAGSANPPKGELNGAALSLFLGDSMIVFGTKFAGSGESSFVRTHPSKEKTASQPDCLNTNNDEQAERPASSIDLLGRA